MPETKENQEKETMENTVKQTETAQERCTTEASQTAGQMDLFTMMGVEPPPAPKPKNDKRKKKSSNACCATPKKKSAGSNTVSPEKLPKDLPIFVVLPNDNYQETFDPGRTLDEIRQELELQYPYLTKNNTNWTCEIQTIKNGKVMYDEKDIGSDDYVEKRVLAIPAVKSNKAG